MNTSFELTTPAISILVVFILLISRAVVRERHEGLRKIESKFSKWDQRYQTLIQVYLDPIIMGRSRNQQMQALTQGQLRDLLPQEKRSNRRLALGIGMLGVLLFVHLTDWQLIPIVIGLALYTIWPMFREAWRLVSEERRLSLYHLLLSYLCCLWIGGYYFVGILGIISTEITSKIQLLSQTVTRHSLTDLLGEQPQTVTVLVEGRECEIPFDQLHVGDTLLCSAGQALPIDGVIIKGEATIDQHCLTGESQPVEKSIGDPVLAGTLVLGGNLQVHVEKTGEETAAAKIILILNQTIENQEIQFADQLRRLEVTLWPMLIGAGLGWLLLGPTTGAALLGCNYLLGLVPLRLLTLLNGIKAAAEQGILVKDGRALERLAKVNTVVFDKTGTLTLNQPQVVAIHCCTRACSLATPGSSPVSQGTPKEDDAHTLDQYSDREVLWWAAAAEQRQSHPIAQAILAAAKIADLQLPSLDDAYYHLGLGLTVQVQNQTVRVGSERFLGMENLSLPLNLKQQQETAHEQGHSLVFVAADDHIMGAVELAASLRPEARIIVDWLKQQDLDLYILSGDQEAPTLQLANELGVNGYFANTLPEQKATRIQELQAQDRHVCFIGDGINDAIALCQAEVSISLGGATTVATDAAQVVLMDDDLTQLQLLWQLTKEFDRSLRINIALARGFSILAAIGVVLLPFKFWVVEILWGGQAIAGITVAFQPLLKSSD